MPNIKKYLYEGRNSENQYYAETEDYEASVLKNWSDQTQQKLHKSIVSAYNTHQAQV